MSLHNKMWPTSTNIASAQYNDELETLDITFQRGAQYRYIGVHPDVWIQFRKLPQEFGNGIPIDAMQKIIDKDKLETDEFLEQFNKDS